jgi:hypothetical protein
MVRNVEVPVNKLEREAIALSARAYRVPRFMDWRKLQVSKNFQHKTALLGKRVLF